MTWSCSYGNQKSLQFADAAITTSDADVFASVRLAACSEGHTCAHIGPERVSTPQEQASDVWRQPLACIGALEHRDEQMALMQAEASTSSALVPATASHAPDWRPMSCEWPDCYAAPALQAAAGALYRFDAACMPLHAQSPTAHMHNNTPDSGVGPCS